MIRSPKVGDVCWLADDRRTLPVRVAVQGRWADDYPDDPYHRHLYDLLPVDGDGFVAARHRKDLYRDHHRAALAVFARIGREQRRLERELRLLRRFVARHDRGLKKRPSPRGKGPGR